MKNNRKGLLLLFLVVISFFVSRWAWTGPEEDRQATVNSLQQIKKEVNQKRFEAFNRFSDEIEKLKTRNDDPKKLKAILQEYVGSIERSSRDEHARRARLSPEPVSEFLSTPFDTDTLDQILGRLDLESQTDPFTEYKLLPEDLEKIGLFLKNNKTETTGMPLSYKIPSEFWKKIETRQDGVSEAIERLILAHGLSIYDAAMWQMALLLLEKERAFPLVDAYTERLTSGGSGALQSIRAWDDPFRYGDQRLRMKMGTAYFFRIIADEYTQVDPRDGSVSLSGFPGMDLLHHEDWKPITGEQAWAVIIGPLQVAYQKYGSDIPLDSEEVKLALSLLPAVEAMQSPIGALYHAPYGTHGKHPAEISNENNFSMFAALKMLKEVVKDKDESLTQRIQKILDGIENYFKQYAFHKEKGVFYQGGYYLGGEFIPNEIFAVDCQTWGTIVMGKDWIDENFGEGAAYQIWKRTKELGGYVDAQGVLQGIDFTESAHVLSVDWTCGAILNTRLLASAYEASHPDWAVELKKDSFSMRHGIELLKVETSDGGLAYLYANTRTFIPFGWWGNPVPSLAASAWVVLLDKDFNPFVLGG